MFYIKSHQNSVQLCLFCVSGQKHLITHPLMSVRPFNQTVHVSISFIDTNPQTSLASPGVLPLHQQQQHAPVLIPPRKARIHRSKSDPVLMDLTAKGLTYVVMWNHASFRNRYDDNLTKITCRVGRLANHFIT